MPTSLSIDPPTPPSPDADEQDTLRDLNRTPHPYHHQSLELPYASDRLLVPENQTQTQNGSASLLSPYAKDSSPASESGTEADDEHFLKGLPAPKTRLHKGLRGQDEVLSGTSTPILSPAVGEDDIAALTEKPKSQKRIAQKRRVIETLRRNKNLTQRAVEVIIVASLGLMVRANPQVAELLDYWERDYQLAGLTYVALLIIYPIRVIAWEYRRGKPSKTIPIEIPHHFDPAPILYPPAITLCVSSLVATSNTAVVLPNIILSICSWPQQLIPKFERLTAYDSVHWGLTCLPLLWSSSIRGASQLVHTGVALSDEDLTLAAALLDIVDQCLVACLVAASPDSKGVALGWGLGTLVFCSSVIRSGILLARVPKWRFRRIPGHRQRSLLRELSKIFSWKRIKSEVFGSALEPVEEELSFSSDGGSESATQFKPPKRTRTAGIAFQTSVAHVLAASPVAGGQNFTSEGIARRHTLPYLDTSNVHNPTQTPSGRRKRTTSLSVRPFLKLTYTQAVIRKWLYALYVYVVLITVILVGIRTHIEKFALRGIEPIGFALGYMFGDLPSFRFRVIYANIDWWIPLPIYDEDDKQCHMGWVQHIRHNDFGEANTRLLIAAYWVCVFVVGLLTVFRLKEIYEVDTRRKVFHFMMVGILLPATFVDPTFAGLALSLILAIFLILDLLRASQLPPLSKPIASFLAPYVDGRDFRGPVVISHIFLLIGCAIPLWLALASLPTGSGYLSGWELPGREALRPSQVDMGRGKSLEGSLAFAIAVFAGIAAAWAWLKVGGWPVAGEQYGVATSARNAAVCASMASLTEAVLTGGNDNVIVPVVLWTCVKSLAI
uniref:dolichol kinase n=1 Tax=Bionectria ochroleuca TaxID=29856 RepID=A0A8H7KC64_BIOOC